MSPEAPESKTIDHARISDVTGISERTVFQGLIKSQPFWVTVALIALSIAIGLYQPSFVSVTNIANVTRNFAPFGIMALGMTCVIITGGMIPKGAKLRVTFAMFVTEINDGW